MTLVMFPSYPHHTTTYQDQATLPPLQQTTYPINNAYNHGAPAQPTIMTELHSAFPGPDQGPTAGSDSAYMVGLSQPTQSWGNPSYQAIPWDAASVPEPFQPRVLESTEVPTDLVLPMVPGSSNTIDLVPILHWWLLWDELQAKGRKDRIEIGLAQEEELKRAADNMHRKRLRPAEPDLGAGPSNWTAESEDRHDAELPDKRSTKRRRITMEGKTEDRVAAQRDETQEQRARRTSAKAEYKSKLGNRGLREETLAVPPQGVYTPFSPRPTTGATLGLTEFKDQAWTWTEGSESISKGTENVHESQNDEETDGERLDRLMVLGENGWKCRECSGQTFFDKSTLRRHCNSVHGRECDRWKCTLCPGTYARKSGLERHMKGKHQ